MIDPITKLLYRGAGRHGPVAVMYHSVSLGSGVPDWPWALSAQRFRAHLDLLADGDWTTVTVRDLLDRRSIATPRTIAITFDDGYSDNLVACKELCQHGMKGTWFVVSGSIGGKPSWAEDGGPHESLLSVNELREMHASGMEIGSHSVNHVRLTTLDDAQLRREVVDSKQALEDAIGAEVVSFAYPYGDWDTRCAEAVREAGYRFACTTATGWATRDADPYRLRRLSVFNDDDVARFARKLALGSHDISWQRLIAYWARRLRCRLAG